MTVFSKRSKKTIFHVDMDAFFASVEVAENPALRGKALIIGGVPGQRGVVSTCSYEARRYGVHSAMSISEAEKRCPHAIFMRGNHSLYRSYSDTIRQLFLACTPYVEFVSIDEAYLDVSSLVDLYGGAEALAHLLKDIILIHTKLTCSVGIAANKMMAKIASTRSKPNGLLLIPEGEEASFLAPLSIDTIPGIGEKTATTLRAGGFNIISDLQKEGLDKLMLQYGKWGYCYYQAACGHDGRSLLWEETAPKSIGAEVTFSHNLMDVQIIKEELRLLVCRVTLRLDAHHMRARGLSLKLRSADFKTVTRSLTFAGHVSDEEEILRAAMRLLVEHYSAYVPLRLLGVSLDKLTNGYWQPTFWD